MTKNARNFLFVLLGSIVVVLAGLNFYFINRCNIQTLKIVKLETNNDIMMGVLNAKAPNINFQQLFDYAEINNITSEKLITIIKTLQMKPFQARGYLLKELNLDDKALNAIVKPFDYENHSL